jgi:hypothetical protein
LLKVITGGIVAHAAAAVVRFVAPRR